MSNQITKSFKIILLAAMPLWFSSQVPGRGSVPETSLEPGRYELKVSGANPMLLKGPVAFKHARVSSGSGESYSTLHLSLGTDLMESGHSLGILIARPESVAHIGAGTFTVVRNIEEFRNYFDGVFGYANLQAAGESPYFAKTGSISLLNTAGGMVTGRMDMRYKNLKGEELRISGQFVASAK